MKYTEFNFWPIYKISISGIKEMLIMSIAGNMELSTKVSMILESEVAFIVDLSPFSGHKSCVTQANLHVQIEGFHLILLGGKKSIG